MEPDGDLARDRAIAATLPRVWASFFGRYGRLRTIQREAIPLVMAGHNVLIVAPTASGKTEAAAAPVAERLLRRDGPRRALYVVPTRALSNDLHQRLMPALNACGLTAGLRTGDHPGAMSENVVLTTPESLDSMLCRGSSNGTHVLDDIGTIVMDEIHLLASGTRGEQLRWLIARLERIQTEARRLGRRSAVTLQRIALSATIADPRGVATDFLGIDCAIATTEGGRAMEILSESISGPTEVIVPRYLKRCSEDRKILIFCNTRRRVDHLTMSLRGNLAESPFQVHAHHGSLAQRPREEAEVAFRERSHIVVVASSTLEIGIDVGDVDLVVLDAPPPDIAALLQRIGRGNRRRGTTRVLACAGNAGAGLLQRALLRAAIDGALGPGTTRPRLAVVRQQILSYVFQSPTKRRRFSQLEHLAEGSGLAALHEMRRIARAMIEAGDLAEDLEFVRLGPNWTDRTTGLHTVIEDAGGMEVVDDRTGASVATGIRYRGGEGLTTGGKELAVKGVTGAKIRTSPGDGTTSEGDWSYAARRMAVGPSQGYALRRLFGLDSRSWPIVPAGVEVAVFHFGGAARAIIVEIALTLAGVPHRTSSPFAVTLSPSDLSVAERALKDISEADVRSKLVEDLQVMERRLGLPFANRSMPNELRLEEAATRLGLPVALGDLRGAELVPAGALSRQLRDLL